MSGAMRRLAFTAIREKFGRVSQREADMVDLAGDVWGIPREAADGVPGAATGRTGALHKVIDGLAFYAKVREVTKPLVQEQVDSISLILKAAASHPIGWVAYELATAWHEARFKPQAEWGRGKGRLYGKPGKYGQPQYGRGFVQLTWDRNYEWADKALGLNGALLKDFDLALNPDIAARILVLGMETGAFTGKKLADYIGDRGTPNEFVQARRIVNGTDKAHLIAGYAEHFQTALTEGKWQ